MKKDLGETPKKIKRVKSKPFVYSTKSNLNFIAYELMKKTSLECPERQDQCQIHNWKYLESFMDKHPMDCSASQLILNQPLDCTDSLEDV